MGWGNALQNCMSTCRILTIVDKPEKVITNAENIRQKLLDNAERFLSDTQLEVLDPEEYFHILISEIDQAEEIIALQAMEFWPIEGTIMYNLAQALIQKQLEAKAQSDFPQLEIYISVSNSSLRDPRFRHIFDYMREIGIIIIDTDEKGNGDHGRKNHRKLSVIDDKCWIGGVNFTPKSASSLDFMLMFEGNPAFREHILYEIVHESSAVRTLPYESEIVVLAGDAGLPYSIEDYDSEQIFRKLLENSSIDKDSLALLIENGLKDRESSIVTAVVDMIGSAESSILLMSQWLPDRRVRKALNEALNRGIDVKIITSGHKVQDELMFKTLTFINSLRFKLLHLLQPSNDLNLYTTDNTHIHAKLILVDGKFLLLGSDNFDGLGEFMQTRETAVFTNVDRFIMILLEKLLKDLRILDSDEINQYIKGLMTDTMA